MYNCTDCVYCHEAMCEVDPTKVWIDGRHCTCRFFKPSEETVETERHQEESYDFCGTRTLPL